MGGDRYGEKQIDKDKSQKFLLNVSTRTIHDANSKDGRCKINTMQDCNKKLFDNYLEAKNYLPKGKKTTGPCAFCLGSDYETKV